MPYSEESDLLTGDLLISSKVDKGKFVNDAAEEIDSKLGFIYVLPLTPIAPALDIPVHERLLLKTINNRLASGRLILTLDIADERSTLHAYGLRLVTEALQELMLIANGTVDLTAVRTNPDESTTGLGSRSPAITNVDATSAVEAFYEWAKPTLTPRVPLPAESIWAPGA